MSHPLVAQLGLQAHPEGGWFRQLYQSELAVQTSRGPRPLANTIHYLLTRDSPLGHLHRNAHDITHFHHLGAAHYLLLNPAGEIEELVLGAGPGQQLSFTCPGGWWKSSRLLDGEECCLISEIVAPGFDFADHQMATAALLDTVDAAVAARLRPTILP
ncbi:MAG: cupin domain-containing protein [Pseudomonadota bacterium]